MTIARPAHRQTGASRSGNEQAAPAGPTGRARRPEPPRIVWPADEVERVRLDKIVGYARNARVHSEAQVGQLAASIREFGFAVPVLLDEQGTLIAGHGRVLAAQKLGLTDVPAMTARGWSDAKIRAYRLADNRLAENATWDAELLGLEFAELRELGADLSLTGFDDKSIEDLLAAQARIAEGLTDPDEAPEPSAAPVSRSGDVWLLGAHRLVCGDATIPADVARCLADARPHLMVTDPPYGVDYDPDWRNDALQAGIGARGAPGGRAVGVVRNDDRADWREAWALFPGDVAYVWHAGTKSHHVAQSLEAASFEIRAAIIWAKNGHVIGRGHYHPQHEPCFYAVRKGKTAHWHGDRSQTTLWQIPRPQKSDTGHSTQKPVECMLRPMANNSRPGDAVYDPFLGSGTTIVAAEVSGRVCYGLEIDPAYCDVGVQRWQAFTGRDATLADSGESFAAVQTRRAPAEAEDAAA